MLRMIFVLYECSDIIIGMSKASWKLHLLGHYLKSFLFVTTNVVYSTIVLLYGPYDGVVPIRSLNICLVIRRCVYYLQ